MKLQTSLILFALCVIVALVQSVPVPDADSDRVVELGDTDFDKLASDLADNIADLAAVEDTGDEDTDASAEASDNAVRSLLNEDDDGFDKRRWVYKCEPEECNVRCRKLLKLPEGTCGFNGKCYCRRKDTSN